MSEQQDLHTTARSFIAAAFAALAQDHVIPRPSYDRFVAVGHHYFGDAIMPLAEYSALETFLNQEYPERFGEPLEHPNLEFSSSYIFSFLDACIARCALDEKFDSDSAAVDTSITELNSVLDTPSYDVVVVRHVSHIATSTADPIEIGDIKVVPQPDNSYGLRQQIAEEITGIGRAWPGNYDPHAYDPPHALLVIQERTDHHDPWEFSNRLSSKLDRFLLVARLLTGGTATSNYEVRGPRTLVSRMNPTLYRAEGAGGFRRLVRRTVRLAGDENTAFAAIADLIDKAEVKREGMTATSFDVALRKFNRSHDVPNVFEQIVDLATALEAALLGGEKDSDGLSLRLRLRASALLATDGDSGDALFKDIANLYDIRSRLVHGGQIPEKDLKKIIGKISTVPEIAMEHFGIATDYAVDRMRDIVRRAILARLCLAAKPEPLWPFVGSFAVDACLSEDNMRLKWRSHWRDHLATLGIGDAADQPRAAVEFLSREDR